MQEMQETRVQSLGQEDPLEEEMTTHSSILAWRIPWTEEPGGLQSMGLQRVGQGAAEWEGTWVWLPRPCPRLRCHLLAEPTFQAGR